MIFRLSHDFFWILFSMDNNHDQLYLMLGELRGDVKAILLQTTKTNGTLNNHSKRIEGLESDKSFNRGLSIKRHGLTAGISSAVSAIIVAIIGWTSK